MKNNHAFVFWFTGLSGSGKTTVAEQVKEMLEKEQFNVEVLDGDDVRKNHNRRLGFSREDIHKNNELIAQMCLQSKEEKDVILVPIISPFHANREKARSLIGENFFEIYFSASLDVVMKRDVKGLYRKAKNKEPSNIIGCKGGPVYEKPRNPDLEINTARLTHKEAADMLYNFVCQQIHGVVDFHRIR